MTAVKILAVLLAVMCAALAAEIIQHRRAMKRMRAEMGCDSLTGLMNRKTAKEKIDLYLRGAHTEDEKCAFIMIDVDHFKRINDTFGHPKGDETLRNLALLLQCMTEESCICARMGGDEFCVFVKNVPDENYISDFAARLCSANDSMCEGASTISVGIAYYPRNGNDFSSLYHRADNALYCAKNNGRNTYAVYGSKKEEESVV